jgi:hypothetical protein
MICKNELKMDQRAKIVNLLEDNRAKAHNIRVGNDFLDMNQDMRNKRKNRQMELHKKLKFGG